MDSARVMYDELGFDTLPLLPQNKNPFARSWQNRPINRLWQNMPEEVNIGIRGGGLAEVAIIDCDEPRTFETVTAWLAGLGYRGDSYPVVQTASGAGRHVYVTFTGGLSGDWRVLSQDIGAGEFRFGAGSYVAASPSRVKDGGKYTLLSGDFSILPSLALEDVLQIVKNKETVIEHKPIIPRKALGMLNGKGFGGYKTNSEAEQALLVSLINAGFLYAEVLDLFNRYPCAGKYAELKARNAKNAERWLSKSYSEAAQWAKTHESNARQIVQAAITWAESRAWQGRTGAVDRLVYLAHAKIAYKAGRLIYAAACRDLAERAGVSHMTATRATWRLCDSGLLVPDKKAVADSANLFQLGKLDIPLHSLSTSTVRKCNTASNHDVFRNSGLGKSAGQIWQALQECPATVDELARITGRHERTIKRVLVRMAKLADPLTGEYLPMVASDDPQGASGGETYHPLPVDLDRIAHAVGTAGTAERQRKEHVRERRSHAQGLLKGREVLGNQQSTSGDSEEV